MWHNGVSRTERWLSCAPQIVRCTRVASCSISQAGGKEKDEQAKVEPAMSSPLG